MEMKKFQIEISHLPPEFQRNDDKENTYNYDFNLPIKDARKFLKKIFRNSIK